MTSGSSKGLKNTLPLHQIGNEPEPTARDSGGDVIFISGTARPADILEVERPCC